MIDPLELTKTLVKLNTAGSGEGVAAHLLGGILRVAGARVEYDLLSPGRATLVAHAGDTRESPLILSGHLDTVPAEPSAWSSDPFAGKIAGDHLVGRGAADMKSGVAALVVALERCLVRGTLKRGIVLVLSAAEETGCQGTQHLVEHVDLPTGGPMLIAEPTGNRVATGHKGALWLRLSSQGVAAHGSRPDLGVNAITPLARVAVALAQEGLPGSHPEMGQVTVNVGTLNGGIRTNLVADSAEMTLDIRLVPGVAADDMIERVRQLAGDDVHIETLLNRAAVYSPASAPLASLVSEVAHTGAHEALTYFTDASVLAHALDCSETVFLGPGEAAQAHTVDESCAVSRIYAASDIYEEVLTRFCAQ
ncbi:MAG: M20 family metallopeptidase [Coriobacteriia bacterium]|nr:M20 family metallopeptidase [Coriobacteriia bacterium]MBN2823145.1 M20 family metallopeptidase [Coriobacteriia bacterium]